MRAGPKLVKAVHEERGDPDKKATAPAIAEAPSPANQPAERTERPPFSILVRGLYQPAAEANIFEGESAPVVIARVLEADVSELDEPILTWRDGDQLVAVDFDRPESAPPLTDIDVPPFFTTAAPVPLAAWTTHDGGLRALFVSNDRVSARAQAGVWLMLAPLGTLAGWTLEIKNDSRHPLGLRDGARCGAVHIFEPSADFSLRRLGGSYTQADVDDWMVAHNLSPGRHPADLCPWDPKAISGNPPVSVTDFGVKCFHCGRYASWSELVGNGDRAHESLYAAARAIVHLPHQRHVLEHLHPVVPPDLLEPAWNHILTTVNADRLGSADADEKARWESKIELASSNGLDIARSSSGGWLDGKTLRSRKVSVDLTLKFLPSAFWPPMVDKAANSSPLEGFTPLHPVGCNHVHGPSVLPPKGTIFVRQPRAEDDPPPVDLGTKAPSKEQVEVAGRVLDAFLPGVDMSYHCGIIAAILVAQRGVGTPPTICATGQSGSSKTAQLHLAAGAVGTRAISITLGTTEDTTRKAGLALEESAGAIYADEVGRVEGVFSKLETILSANTMLRYRPKYANEREAPFRAAVVLLGSTLPEAIVRSPELARRSVGYRLTGADKYWALIDPKTNVKLDLSEARKVDLLRPHLDVITASVWWAIHDLGVAGDWRLLLIEKYGAQPLPNLDLVDADGVERTAAIRGLYNAYCTAKKNQLSTMRGWSDWLIADPGTKAGDYLNALLDFEGDRARFKAETSDLERQNLAPVLGIRTPQLQLLIRRRAPHYLAKFVTVGVIKGQGLLRADLPALDQDAERQGRTQTVTV